MSQKQQVAPCLLFDLLFDLFTGLGNWKRAPRERCPCGCQLAALQSYREKSRFRAKWIQEPYLMLHDRHAACTTGCVWSAGKRCVWSVACGEALSRIPAPRARCAPAPRQAARRSFGSRDQGRSGRRERRRNHAPPRALQNRCSHACG